MNESDRAALIQQLTESRQALMDAIAAVCEEEAARMPESGWSILGCVEHCAIAERGMLAMIARASEPAEEGHKSQEQALAARSGDRSRPFDAPEAVQPKGRYATLELAASRFREARERTIAFIESCEDDLRARMVDHPMGRMTARECLVVMIGHPKRHARQIAELRGR